MVILTIKNLFVENESKQVLKNLNLLINENENHVIMGPNGSGKSTFAKTLAGHPNYKITDGSCNFLGKDLQLLSAEKRVKNGIFLAFQSPVEIAGLSSFEFFNLIYNEQRIYNSQAPLSPLEFLPVLKTLCKKIGIEEELLGRDFNVGFSGGEKKKSEILQMLLLEPKLAILDEIDSGLDLDALKKMCEILKSIKNISLLIITHSPKIAEILNPNFLHIFCDGKIQKTGDKKLISQIDLKGYDYFINQQNSD